MKLTSLDPRVKLFLLIGLSTTALAARKLPTLLALLFLAVLILLAGRISISVIWIKLRGLFGLIAMLFLLQCLFHRNGNPLLSAYGLTLVTDLGFQTAVLVNLRLLIIVLSALIVISGEARDYLLSLTSLKVPYEIAFMVLAAMRFLPMLRREAQDVLFAAQMRGLRLKKTGLKRQAGAYISIALPVIASAVQRAEQLSIAMEARGFRAFPQRTSMHRLRMRSTDWAYTFSFCAAITAILVLSNR